MSTYMCPCCEHTVEGDGFYDICSVCRWENCGETDLDVESGPNHMTLREGRQNYIKYGDCEIRCQHGRMEMYCDECFPVEVLT